MSDLSGDYRSQPSAGIWSALNRFLLTLIVCTAAIPIGYSFLPEVKRLKEQSKRSEDLKLEIEQQRMKLSRAQMEEDLLKHDSEYIGLLARDKLGLMKEGETIYRLDPPQPDPQNFWRHK